MLGKRLKNIAWSALAAAVLVLLVSAVNKKNNKPCRSIQVTFGGDGNNFFIEEKDITDLLKANGSVIGKPVGTINLKILEETLKNDKWIANTQLFFDNNQVLQVTVEQKTPVARIFTTEGISFYIDSACKKLPLSEKLSARIPMFTNFPSDRAELSKPDSELLASVKDLAVFIQADDFWKAQVSQVDITPDGFVMVPTVGSHIVQLGKGGDWQQKFDRLFSFYRQVWTKVGFEKYGKIDVQFDGQVVATLKGANAATIDSVKAETAYNNLLEDVTKLNEDSSSQSLVQIAMKDTNTGAKAVFAKTLAVAPAKTQIKETPAETKSTKLQAAKSMATKQTVKVPAKKHRSEKKPVRQQAKSAQATQTATSKQPEGSKAPKAVMRKPITRL